ncbi:FG-GAP-like repeat-containing protein [Flavobacterium sp. EDS]|uniref:FG-GAP repeat domain-containing protein n=1 Tax=Flavobacterium sp. EDS TaxID=2897328 RepID=UPI001E645877|nr:VCBS repeat-containing protein [Flavobacterium sp. EDS]MCD0473975.1 FG-GAP-like repeat-containing protein [Flavobacterium sp. EDS]
MRQFYLTILFISLSFFTTEQTNPTGPMREAGITDGDLSVTLSGGASYSVPIAVPPGINGVIPEVSLNYNSQGGNGSAGYGWALSGLSSISRIPATKFHDGTIDGVDFDALDRFALDGQRLLVKNGTSGVNGGNETTYETEIFSNIKITSHGIHPSGVNFGPAYFLVEYPDGSKAYYGNSTDSRSITEWSITYWENAQGIRISYLYNQANNLLEIATIKYGTLTTTTPINQIQFIYEPRVKSENYYIGGQNIIRSNRLKEIKSSGNNIGFRNYVLDYNMAQSSEKYDRLYSITEKSGDNTKSYNPTVFNYNNTDDSINYNSNPTVLSVNSVNSTNAVTVNGDFDGDGNMDFILYPKTGVEAKSIYWIFTGITPNTGTQTILNLGLLQEPGAFDEILPVSWLSSNNKLMNGQGWTVVKTNPTTNLTTFKTYPVGPSSINPQGEKSYTFPKFSYYSEHPLSCTSTRPPFFYTVNIPKRYLNGDFNGDGLTDIAVVEENLEYSYLAPCDSNNEPLHTTSNYSGDTYFMNLDRRLNSNFVNNAGKLIVLETSKTYVADFNGDGKSDIYVFDTGKVRVYSLNDNKQFILLYQTPTTDTSIQLSRPILIGDFNGDGKSDFMIPIESGNGWYRYLSTGTTFAKENRNIAYITPNDSFNSYNYIATDYDNDGKSKSLRCIRRTMI